MQINGKGVLGRTGAVAVSCALQFRGYNATGNVDRTGSFYGSDPSFYNTKPVNVPMRCEYVNGAAISPDTAWNNTEVVPDSLYSVYGRRTESSAVGMLDSLFAGNASNLALLEQLLMLSTQQGVVAMTSVLGRPELMDGTGRVLGCTVLKRGAQGTLFPVLVFGELVLVVFMIAVCVVMARSFGWRSNSLLAVVASVGTDLFTSTRNMCCASHETVARTVGESVQTVSYGDVSGKIDLPVRHCEWSVTTVAQRVAPMAYYAGADPRYISAS
ncbi:hypothetical protein BDZ88DRAFT_32412 [Geranomyces variabilis]|nr:hypothetical protein BDZ88DRAFT_32412 [Geranomyces variabilis]